MLKNHPHKQLIYWLFTGCVMIALMVVIGGITRLTHSGLSMTDWNLISGAIPPLTEVEWEETFEQYKQFPEYQKVNKGMSLSAFKAIFFWEYLHRLIGRTIGLVFVIPFLMFWRRKRFPQGVMPKMLLIFFLGAFQGFLGWWMVKSGLVDRPEVSHYRLAAHLSSAFLLIVYTFWVMLELYFQKPMPSHAKLNAWVKWILLALSVQIVYGAFVAGLKAGLLCPVFPAQCGLHGLMDGNWTGSLTVGMPEHMAKLNVQNIHRFLAYLVYALVGVLAYRSKQWKLSDVANKGVNMLFFWVNVQFALGVFTLLYQVPVTLGVLHQFGALCLLLSAVYLLKVSK
jgi:cytochrome c oxidase assembly protein subunit 15